MNYPKVEKVTEPGWYWVRVKGDLTWVTMEVTRGDWGNLSAYFTGADDPLRVIEIDPHSEIRGPIPEPEEEADDYPRPDEDGAL